MQHDPTPQPPHPAKAAAALALAATLLPGCSSWFSSDEQSAQPAFKPADFVGEPRTASAPPDPPVNLVVTDTPDPDQGADPRETPPRSDQALPVNAMVGHINGEAVYADQVFNPDIEAQLRNFGRRFDDQTFREQAARVIKTYLEKNVIMSKLLLGEAERNLTDRERQYIDYQVRSYREELLRFYGQGSIAKAKAEFLAERGAELEDHLREFREKRMSDTYEYNKIRPKIVVNERDIERWYEDHKARYEQPDSRVLRLMKVADRDAAQTAEQRLKAGEAFEKVAADPDINTYNASGAGLFNAGDPLTGDIVIGIKPVNEALIPLAVGEYAGPISAGEHFYFVQVIERTEGRTVPFAQAQLEIRQILELSQREKEYNRFRSQVWDRGSFTDPDKMLVKLLEIADARYNK